VFDVRSKAQKVDDFVAEMLQGVGGRLARCEVCGETPGAQVDLGYVVCFGLNYRSAPMRRCLCRKHAIRRCLACNVYTGICGWWGIPGVATGPQRMWDNAMSVRRAFKANMLTTNALFGAGFVFWFGVLGLFILLATTDLVNRVLE
jgi:hypothetical protein